jgi:hypothetical protein
VAEKGLDLITERTEIFREISIYDSKYLSVIYSLNPSSDRFACDLHFLLESRGKPGRQTAYRAVAEVKLGGVVFVEVGP